MEEKISTPQMFMNPFLFQLDNPITRIFAVRGVAVDFLLRI